MIESLTPEQEEKLAEYRDKWLAIGLATRKEIPTDKVETLFRDLYTQSGLTPPKRFIYVDSPQAGHRLVKELSTDAPNPGYGNHDAAWLGFYDYFVNVVKLDLGPRINLLINLAYHIHWYWPLDQAVVISNRPTELHMRNERLHRDLGPAVLYADGFGVWSLNGVSFSPKEGAKWIAPAPEDLPTDEVLSIRNVEQRAEIIKKIGIDKLFIKLKPKLLDTKDGYELYAVTLYEDFQPRIYVKMQNPSVDEIHVEAVHPDCKTVDQALAWRNWGKIDVFTPPLVLT